MRLSPTTGQGVMGQGGGTLSIDGVTPASLVGATGGGWGWLDDTTCAGQADTGTGYTLYQLAQPNTLTVLDATSTGATDAAQNFRAGLSEWAAWMSGGVLKGTRSATVPFAGGVTVGTCTVLPLTGLGDIDDSGRVFLIANYAGDAGIVAYTGAGAKLWTVSAGVLDGSNRIRAKNGSVAYQDTDSAWHLLSATTGVLQSFAPRTDEVVAMMVPVSISGSIWVVELTNTRLTIRPATSSNGYVLATSANLFFPDAVSLSAGTVRVGWSVTTGEAPTDMRLADLTIGTGGLSTGTTASGSLVITPQSPLTASNFPIGPIEGGGTLSALKQPRQALKADAFVGGEDGKRIYQKYWDQVAAQAFGDTSAGAQPVPTPTPPTHTPSFGTIDVSGQSPVVATVAGDAVQFIAGTGMTLTTDAAAQSVTFDSAGGDVTHTGILTLNQVIYGNGGADIKAVAATDGQIPIGKTSDGTAIFASLTAGSNITLTPGPNSITISATAASADYVVLSDGVQPPTPVNDGAGNFIYVGYTP